jgi:DNA-binding NarL/FixJ family response regulator
MLQQMEESGTGPISPGIAHKILQMVQKNELTLPAKSPVLVQQDFFDLTQREKEILQLLVKGLAYRTIGAQLNISAHTAKKHVMNIYQKLHINSRAQALRLAYEKGML